MDFERIADGFSIKLKSARLAANMTLENVAMASGMTKSHVWELEQGRCKNLSVRAVWSLSDALGVSPAYMLGLDPAKAGGDPLASKLATIIRAEMAKRGLVLEGNTP